MGVTTRGGARACVVGTGSTAARAHVPPARGTRGVVRAEPGRRQSRGLAAAAEGAVATGAAAPVRGWGAKRSAPAAPDALEGASTARRRAGEAVTDVASLTDTPSAMMPSPLRCRMPLAGRWRCVESDSVCLSVESVCSRVSSRVDSQHYDYLRYIDSEV